MPSNPKSVGETSEAHILAHLLKKGWAVSIPFGNNQRYDMIVDTGTALIRAQCKTGRPVNGSLVFSVASRNRRGERFSYHGQIEAFLIFDPNSVKVYLFPLELAGSNEVRLRTEPAKGGPKSVIHWANDYEI